MQRNLIEFYINQNVKFDSNKLITLNAKELADIIDACTNTEDLFTYDQRLSLLCSAIEGGSNYWYYLPDNTTDIVEQYMKNGTYVDGMMRALMDERTLDIYDIEDEISCLGSISLQSIREGEKIMRADYPAYFAEVLTDQADANTGDVWFQLSIFKKLIYG